MVLVVSWCVTMAKPSSLLDTRVIYCGDNLEQLKKLPDACVDLIYIDPPFNSNRNYEVFWGETKEKRSFDDRHESTQAYIEFMRPRCVELARVLKKTGSFLLPLRLACEPLRQGDARPDHWVRTTSRTRSCGSGLPLIAIRNRAQLSLGESTMRFFSIREEAPLYLIRISSHMTRATLKATTGT